MISILITAYKSQDFIEDCLDSIMNQTIISDIEYEIIIGIDNCEETLNKLNEIRHKYRNLKILMMCSNKGTYVTRNSIAYESIYDNLLFFDSDDIMMPNMLEILLKNNSEIIRYKYLIFKENKSKTNTVNHHAYGTFFITKKSFLEAGGYLDNRFSCDMEFCKRTMRFIKHKLINKPLFYYRMTENNLTNIIDSEERIEWNNKYKNHKYKIDELYVNPVKNMFIEK
jgi:glycosyltransferase involved in cell wall biosynthesis